MTRKIFVSYKYRDFNVKTLDGQFFSTPRDYVDQVDELLAEEDHIYKGEDDDQDLSELSEDEITTKLCNRIYDSTLTIVIISPGMNNGLPEKYQWIPWEVSYSLRETSRGGRLSRTNALFGIVLPDQEGNYNYFMLSNTECQSIMYRLNFLFPILRKNMFNQKKPATRPCNGNIIYSGYHSYLHCATWEQFKNDPNQFINIAYSILENKDQYEIVKSLEC